MADQLTLEVEGTQYTGFNSVTVSSTFEAVSSTFTFNITALSNITNFPIKIGNACRVLVNKIPIINGYIEKNTIDYSSNSHNISLHGRDKTCDIIDSTLCKGMSFSPGITLEQVTQNVFKYLNITGMRVYSTAGNLAPFAKGELVASETGMQAFNFIARYASRRQVLVTTDGDGNIVFARPSEKVIKTVLNLDSNAQSTILHASVDRDNTKRFSKYILNVQQSLSGMSGNDLDFNHKDVVNTKAIATDNESAGGSIPIRASRILNLMQSEQSASTKDLQKKAHWEANTRRAKSFKYTVTVQGFSPINDPDLVWRPNLLVTINDSFCSIPSSSYLIQTVEYNYSISEGSTSTLTLIDGSAYSPEELQGIRFKDYQKKHSQGKGIIL